MEAFADENPNVTVFYGWMILVLDGCWANKMITDNKENRVNMILIFFIVLS